MFDERRKYMRFDALVDGEFHVKDSHVNGIFTTNNFSRGGFNALLNRQIGINTTVEFEMRFPESIMIFFATGKVVWVKDNIDLTTGFNAGIEFKDIDPIERQRVVDYCYENWNKTNSVSKKTEVNF